MDKTTGRTGGNRWTRLLTLGLLGLTLAGAALGQEWTRFRGPNGSGVSRATTIPSRWTEKDFHWKVELPGVGHSSPVVWGQGLFVTSAEEKTGKRLLLCLDAQDGQRRWVRSMDGPLHRKH